ncbi:MAG TPA: vWA domain-containing protein, partial [Pirellula sp.]|nr:vWA domain-containing protein [Pirellula sp.]
NQSAYAPLDKNDNNVNLIMDSSLVAGNQMRISVRGNYRESQLVAKDDTNSYQIRFQRPPTSPSTIRVNAKSDPITMWVLLDCSGSMAFDNIHEKARTTAKSLLEHIQELNENGECPINVGLIAFGRRDNVPTPTAWTKSSIGNQIFKSQIKTGAEISQLIELVDSEWIQPSGCTPLYDAIYTACEGSKADNRNWIVVISDGSNDVNDDLKPVDAIDDGTYYIIKGGNKNVKQIKQRIEDSKSSLFIGQVKNDRYYIESKRTDGTPKFDREKRGRIDNANSELRELFDNVSSKKLGGATSKLFYNDFKSLEHDLIASLPYSTVTVDSDGRTIASGRFGKNIGLQVNEPIDATVKIQSFGQTANTVISLVGSEGLKFNYSDSNGLNCIKFSEDRQTFGLGTDFSRMSSSGENSLRVFAKITPHSDSSMYQLVLQVAIQGTAAENIQQKLFTRRPVFVLAAIKPAGGGPETSTLISDTRFLPMTHYPILLFPNIPWKKEEKWLSEQIDFDVWMADKLPEKAVKVSLKSGDHKELKEFDKMIVCKRTDNDVTVQIQSRTADRFFVICNSAKDTTRTMVEGKETEAKFELQEGDEKPVELVVVKESDLKQSVEQGSVKHYGINDMRFLKR